MLISPSFDTPYRKAPPAKGFRGPVYLPGDGFRSGSWGGNLGAGGGSVGGDGISTTITDVRVEANDIASATLRWTYEGLLNVKAYRSTDNIVYTLVDTITSTYPASTAYEYVDDGTLDERTLYYYKLTDDNGATYSAPVHVVSYIEAMPRGNAQQAAINVSPAYGEVTPEIFNALVDKINYQNQASIGQESAPCEVCSQNNSLIINCTSGCEWFRVIMTEDYINSISLVGCDGCPPIDFVIPPNEVRGICGWPIGCNYDNDECFEAPIPGGPDGRVGKTFGVTYNGYWQTQKPLKAQSSGCLCPQASTALNVTVCSGTLSC